MTTGIYQALTRELNQGRVRAIISSGQAVVLHGLAMMSKDGDWILREDAEALEHVLAVLAARGARYRFGAPLDLRWLARGWSAHLQFQHEDLRIRTDFVTRPARLSEQDLVQLWADAREQDLPVVGIEPLARIKRTNREKDYAVIGELARLMTDVRDRLRHSRSARDLLGLAARHPLEVQALADERPALQAIPEGREALEVALDAERRALMRANEDRLAIYVRAASAWVEHWKQIAGELAAVPLQVAHARMVKAAEDVLPVDPGEPDA
jgi:hypothetical protein